MNKFIIFPVLAFAVAGLVVLDTQAVRETSDAVFKLSTGSTFGSNIANQEADFDRVVNCNRKGTVSADGVSALNAEWRACMMHAMPLTTTAAGGMLFARNAARWMKLHPEDTAFMSAAEDVIRSVRKDLVHSKPFFDAVEKAGFAQQNSFVYRVIGQGGGDVDQFSRWAKEVNILEFQLHLPELASQQIDWQIKANAHSSKAETTGGISVASK